MKKSVFHSLIVCSILLISFGFGLLFDFVCTKMEYKKYPESYQDLVLQSAEEYGIPKELLYALIQTESGFQASQCSEDGKIGLMQIHPSVYLQICEQMPGENTPDPAVLYDPHLNIKSGAYWLQSLYLQYGSWNTALAAYHIGTETVDAWLENENYTDQNGYLTKIPDETTATFISRVNHVKEIYIRLYSN